MKWRVTIKIKLLNNKQFDPSPTFWRSVDTGVKHQMYWVLLSLACQMVFSVYLYTLLFAFVF